MQYSKTFVALKAASSVRQAMQRLMSSISIPGKVHWVAPSQLHLTLKFLGEVENVQLPDICDILREKCRDVDPFEITFEQCGTFPTGKPPRVIWIGVGQGSQQLQQLHRQLDDAFESVGVVADPRRFQPHLTLGRVKKAPASELLEALTRQGADIQEPMRVEKVTLMSTVKTGGELDYVPVDTVAL